MEKNKNIIVLAMSTLNCKNINDIKESRYAWKPDDNVGSVYYGQLEPTSRMIREREGSLDRVIILATKETKKKDYELNGRKISSVDYYIERMGLKQENQKVIDIEEMDFIPAISDTVNEIKNYWEENSGKVNLWIDTQGSFRNINLVLNAIITLLRTDGIIPNGIYSMNYNRDNALQRIVDQTDTYKIFNFVSGINEFIVSGRAEQLTNYYNQIGKKIPEVIQIMKDIGEAIQMCDIIKFDNNLGRLRAVIGKSDIYADDLVGIFIEQIKRDYGKLLTSDCTGLDIVEWFYRKGFYQQAITYVEAKLPKEWHDKNIITFEIDDNILTKLKNALGKNYAKGETEKQIQSINVLIGQVIKECFKYKTICYTCNDTIQYIDLEQWDDKYNYKKADNLDSLDVKIIKNGKSEILGKMKVEIHCTNRMDVMKLLFLYKLLKNERNNFNHMSENIVRSDMFHLGKTIEAFIGVGRKVYEDVC